MRSHPALELAHRQPMFFALHSFHGQRPQPPKSRLLPLFSADREQRQTLSRVLNAITSATSIIELKARTQQALPLLLPCENFVFACGHVKAHRVFIKHLISADAVSESYLQDIVGPDGMIPPLCLDPIEHCGLPKFTSVSALDSDIDQIWAGIFRRYGIRNLAWMILPCLHRNAFSAYFFQNLPASVIQECKVRMALLTPYVHIALNRTLGARRLLQHSGGKGRAQCLALLSAREIEIARWVARGKTNWEIGQILHISDKTVKTHMQNIFSKLQATSRAQIAALFADA
ncbi:helix-turn-helix transcriptional regulator [Pseudomonas sp. WHRI 8822A]|uniref:helix-turn-helix transcriptional regulator n=1 Tax=Pseudomonas sp. WHRI 8822A TaxID=3162568 RepID=UPI0032EB0912